MQYTREEVIARLLKSYEAYYNITLFKDEQTPITARCDFFEHSKRYVLSEKAELWSADREEFLYLLDIPHLTTGLFEKWRDYIYKDGMSRIHVGPGHMYSFITPIFVCDTCDEDARRALKKGRIYKSFHFSLHGWMDYHTVAVELSGNRLDANRGGGSTVKILKKVLYSQTKKGELYEFISTSDCLHRCSGGRLHMLWRLAVQAVGCRREQ